MSHGSEEQLLELGVSEHTLNLLKVIVDVHDWEPSDVEPSEESMTTYTYLIHMAKTKLDHEIGNRFEIVIV